MRSREALAAIYPRALLDETVRIAERCQFHLDNLNYRYPQELVPVDETPISHLRNLTYVGAALRWPEGLPGRCRARLNTNCA